MAVTSNTQSGENIVAFTWTVESLKEHFTTFLLETDRRYEERFIAQEKAINTALIAQEKAINAALTAAKEAVLKAESASEKRFEAVNEFRKTLSDQSNTFIPRTEAIQRADNNAERIANLEKRINETLAVIHSRLDLNAGKSTGMATFWGYVVGGIGLAATIVSIIVVLSR